MLFETLLLKYNQYLLESRLDFISEKYKNKISPEQVNKYHDLIPDKSHLEWVVKQHINNNIHSHQELVDTLSHFLKVKKQLPNKDINSYKTLNDLNSTVSQYTPEDKSNNVTQVYNQDGINIKIAKTHEASIALAKLSPNNKHYHPTFTKASWCNSADSNNGKTMFDIYSNIGSHPYIIEDGTSKCQIHLNHQDEVEANDEKNQPIDLHVAGEYLSKITYPNKIQSDEDYRNAIKSNLLYTHNQIDHSYETTGSNDDSLIYHHFKRFGKLLSTEAHPTRKIQEIIATGNKSPGVISLGKSQSPLLESHLKNNPNDKLINHMIKQHIIVDNKIPFSNDAAKMLMDRFKSDKVTTNLLFNQHSSDNEELMQHVFKNNIISKDFIKGLFKTNSIHRIPAILKENATKYGDYKDAIYEALKSTSNAFDELHNHLDTFSHSKEGADYFIHRYMNDNDVNGTKEEKYKKLYDLATSYKLKTHNKFNLTNAMLDNYPNNIDHSKFTHLAELTSAVDNGKIDTSSYNKNSTNRLTSRYIDIIKHDKNAVDSILTRHVGNIGLHEDEINKLFDANHYTNEEIPTKFQYYKSNKILDHVANTNILKLHHLLAHNTDPNTESYIHKMLDKVIPTYTPNNYDHLATINHAIEYGLETERIHHGTTLSRLLHPSNSHSLLQQVIPEVDRYHYHEAYSNLSNSDKAHLIDRYSHE